MNEKEKNSKAKQSSSATPKRTYRKRAVTKDKETREKNNNIKTETQADNKTKTRVRQSKEVKKTPVKIIPLGGLNEIGKNMTVFECSNDMFILDCGLAFPDADMPGVDIVIPDFTYVERNQEKIRGIVITHGHEDHIGGRSIIP